MDREEYILMLLHLNDKETVSYAVKSSSGKIKEDLSKVLETLKGLKITYVGTLLDFENISDDDEKKYWQEAICEMSDFEYDVRCAVQSISEDKPINL